ncbi:uncharacterized protein LDX57_010603 [Aspergillus melleus]|uniref:uncharacterized protein n=1 Tax=Aspergillus melleus TaxID=138277 RepID=UPI001E8D36B9|nr:uncharacterized protein LDX57_010603 [Aspergillus melleus]KAH8432968.1 hypothetical protein LDX57_010603 [Aspergillus melleus]
MELPGTTDRKEFTSFKRKLAEHFSTDSLFFEHDSYRVREALRHVSQSLTDRWMIHSQGTGNESWLQFHSFLYQQLPTTRYIASYAESLYQHAQKRENQSVHQFTRHLGGLEAVMPHLFDEAERSHKLWEGNLPEICQISELHPNEDSLHALVASLEKAEASLPERVRALGGTIPPRGHPNRRSKRRRR